MKREKGKEPIRDAVKRLDESLWHKLEVLWGKATKGILEVQKSAIGHQQGLSHVKAVEDNLYTLIPDEWKGTRLSALDMFLLSAGACLHDVGKAGDRPGDHGHISFVEIRKRCQEFELEKSEAEAVSWLVVSHNDKNLEKMPPHNFAVINQKDVYLRPLAALICLADTLHCDRSRVQDQANKMYSAEIQNEFVSKFRKLVRGWVFDGEGRIELQGTAKELKEIEIFHKGFAGLQREIEPIIPVLHDAGYAWELVGRLDDSEIKYSLPHVVAGQHDLPGMDFYHEKDKDIFKGRDTDTDELYKLILANPVSLLVADSGLGKSSLVCAGVFPYLDKLGNTWKHVWSRPFKDPTKFIINDVYRTLFQETSPPDNATIIDTFRRISIQLSAYEVLLVIDQLEDIGDIIESRRVLDFEQALVAKLAKRFNNIHILIVYRTDVDSTIGPWLQKLCGSKSSLNRQYLKPLKEDGALEALKALFFSMQIGYESEVLENVVSDIKAQGRDLYPPFIQMVAQTLAKAACKGDSIITGELYTSLGKAVGMIGNYLMQQLKEFGSREEDAKAVLKFLVRATGSKGKASFDVLHRETVLEGDTLRSLIKDMVERRLVRPIGGREFEIIHDHFAQLVDSQLVSFKEREIKQIKELLASKATTFYTTNALLSNSEMAQIYIHREKIFPDTAERTIVLQSCLGEFGPGWYWFRGSTKEELSTAFRNAVSHPYERIKLNALNALVTILQHDALNVAREMLKETGVNVREAAIQSVGKLGTIDDLPALRETLKEPRSYIRKASIKAIGNLGTREDLPVLKKALLEPEHYVRRAAVEAIGEIGTREDMPVLREMLKDAAEEVRTSAIEAIGKVVTREDLPALRGMLIAPDLYIRRAAILAIGKIVTSEDMPMLKEMLKDPEEHLRTTAVEAIGKVIATQDLSATRKMVNDPEFYVRKAAIDSIGVTGSKEDLLTLRKKVKAPEFDIRWAAIEAIGKVVARQDISALRKMLNDPEPYIRKAAIHSIGEIGTKEDLPALKYCCKAPDGDISWAAIEAIGKVVARQDISALRKMLNDPEPYNIRIVAINSIGEIGTKQDLPALRGMLKEHDLFVRRASILAIGKLGTREDMPVLRKMLKDPDEDMRTTAVEAISELVTREKVPALREMIKDTEFYVRRAAVGAIGKLGTMEDMPILREMIKDTEFYVRRAAVEAIGKLGTREDMPILREMLKDTEFYVRRATVEAMESLRSREDLPALREMLKDPDEDVRMAAIETLGRSGDESDLNPLAEIVINSPFSGYSEVAIEALVLLDRRLYCPFSWPTETNKYDI